MLSRVNYDAYMEESPIANELQKYITTIAWGLNGGTSDIESIKTEYDAVIIFILYFFHLI